MKEKRVIIIIIIIIDTDLKDNVTSTKEITRNKTAPKRTTKISTGYLSHVLEQIIYF